MTEFLIPEAPKNIVDVRTAQELDLAVEQMSRCSLLGVDTESNSMYVYKEQVCYLQIRAEECVYLIDTLVFDDLRGLGELFGDANIVKVMHGADYDVVCLGRDFGVQFRAVFDTMLAAQFLDKEGLGLAALCKAYYDVDLDKSLTRFNWGIRPLEEKYVKYLIEDVLYLGGLEKELREEIQEAGIVDEVEQEFLRVAATEWSPRPFEPNNFMKIKGVRDLDLKSQSILKALFVLREQLSEASNKPPFKVLNNEAMLAVARRQTADPEVLGARGGLRPQFMKRYGKKVCTAIEKALAEDFKPCRPPRRKDGRPGRELTPLYDALRAWRKTEAERRKCPNGVVLPNHVLDNLLHQLPIAAEGVAAIPYIGESRRERYTEALLKLIAEHRP